MKVDMNPGLKSFQATPGPRLLGVQAPILGTLSIPSEAQNSAFLLSVPDTLGKHALSLDLKGFNVLKAATQVPIKRLIGPPSMPAADRVGYANPTGTSSIPVGQPSTGSSALPQSNVSIKEFAWSEFIKKSAEGVTLAAGPLALTALPNVSTAEEIAKHLTLYNVPAGSANDLSNNLFAFLKSHFGAALCVGVAGGIVTIFILDGANVRMTAKQKFVAACCVVAALTLVVGLAFHFHYLSRPQADSISQSHEKSVKP